MTVRFTAALLGLALMAAAPAGAQDRPIRMVLASSKIPSVGDTPLHFRLLRITIPAGQSVTYMGPQGMVYPTSGSFTLVADGERRTVKDGEGMFVAAGRRTTFTVGANAPGTLLHYLLVTDSERNDTLYPRPAAATELYRTTNPIPSLKSGPYEFTLSRVTVNPKIPAPPMHHRSGAALYYVLAGSWTIHMEDRQEPRGRGAVQFEPNSFIHTWENVGETTGALLQANISPENVPEIIFIKRP
jgi:mannose-6-phosphate isomerase-like protein (cupin superfamily)